jgi:hypothetical protein
LKKYIFFLIILSGCVSKIPVIEKEKINIFSKRKDSVFSPSGIINREEKAFSPDGNFYAIEIEPYGSGKVGIFLKDGEIFNIINTLKENEKNDLKCITWHPDSSVIGIIYHKNIFSDILFYEIYKGQLLRKIRIAGFYHYMVFDEKGNKIYISPDGEKIKEINLRNTDFVLNSGINLPWINYGWDIGRNPWEENKHGGFSSNRDILLERFKFFKSIGANIVRVFLFCDLRSGIIFDNKDNPEFDNFVFRDFETLIEVSKETEIKILPVIFDYTIADGIKEENGIDVGEHPEIFNDSEILKKILNLFENFFKKIKTENLIFAWDIINEPENLKIDNEKIENFIISFIKLIRKTRKNEYITIGSISGEYLYNYKKFNLDFYQFHYYDSFEFSPLEYHVYNFPFDKPVIIGEIEPGDLINKLTKIWENGYKGVFIWKNDDFLKNNWRFYKSWVDVH